MARLGVKGFRLSVQVSRFGFTYWRSGFEVEAQGLRVQDLDVGLLVLGFRI